MTKHGHRSVRRSNEPARMQHEKEQSYILNRKSIKNSVYDKEQDAEIRREKKDRQ